MGEPARVGELLAALPGLAERMAEVRLIAAWPAIAGPAAARSRAEGVEAGCLSVAVDSSGWLHRLSLEEPTLRARCRAIADIRGIRFHLAPVPAPAPAPPAAGDVGADAEAAIETVLTPLRDHPTVAEALRRAMRAEQRAHAAPPGGERP